MTDPCNIANWRSSSGVPPLLSSGRVLFMFSDSFFLSSFFVLGGGWLISSDVEIRRQNHFRYSFTFGSNVVESLHNLVMGSHDHPNVLLCK